MTIGLISIIALLLLMLMIVIGVPLGFASAALSVVILMMKFGPEVIFQGFGAGPLNLIAQRIYGIVTDYVMISIPLFIFMAALLERSNIARDMFSSLNFWFNRTRGGLAVVTSVMAIIMAAMSGIVGGEVVLLGLIALPQMLRLGYDKNLSVGIICASGSLGAMIPPSLVLIMYGLVTETSIKSLFSAAFIPGLLLGGLYITYIIVVTRLKPEIAPLPEPVAGDPSSAEKTKMFFSLVSGALAIMAVGALLWRVVRPGESGSLSISYLSICAFLFLAGGCSVIALGLDRLERAWAVSKGLIAPLIVIGVVLGSIYGGVTGITEAAGVGAVAVLLMAVLRGEASIELVWDGLIRTLRSTGTIVWVTIGATALAGAYTLAGGPTYIANLINGSELSTFAVLLLMMLIFLVMGAFMDWVGIVLLIMPVFLPIVQSFPAEEIGLLSPFANDASMVTVWFGVLFCVNMQVSFLSPPFGPAAFYLKSVAPAHITLADIFRGFVPFIIMQILVVALLLLFPEIAVGIF